MTIQNLSDVKHVLVSDGFDSNIHVVLINDMESPRQRATIKKADVEWLMGDICRMMGGNPETLLEPYRRAQNKGVVSVFHARLDGIAHDGYTLDEIFGTTGGDA